MTNMFTRRDIVRGAVGFLGTTGAGALGTYIGNEMSGSPYHLTFEPVPIEGHAKSGMPTATGYVVPTPLRIAVALRKPMITPHVAPDELGVKLV